MISNRSALPDSIAGRLTLPLIAAPMLRVSGPDLVVAACRAGVIGAFPTKNARSSEELDTWLGDISARLSDQERRPAPFCPNLIMRDVRLKEDLACVARWGAEMVITSVGSPAPAISALHDAGCLVLADVATLRHAERAIEAGADGLILLTAGAGGQTGWLNPFAFVRAVREMFNGIVVLAGGVSDGRALAAARVLGCDLAYMGTRFIAVRESLASDAYRAMLVEASMDDVTLTSSFTGLPANMLAPSIRAAGLDPAQLEESISEARARERFGAGAGAGGARRWTDIWSAGHSVSGVRVVQTVEALVRQTKAEYVAAQETAATSMSIGQTE
ncbi:MAG TPA: nitronate monooxygenase [Caulobacteraceae bacterium]|jgi:nitronate monooxygenase|nr:nitronate monooxygenase [Caulobacteraceae bacterium]